MNFIYVVTNFYGNADYNNEIVFSNNWEDIIDVIYNDTMLQKELCLGYAAIYKVSFNHKPIYHPVKKSTVYY